MKSIAQSTRRSPPRPAATLARTRCAALADASVIVIVIVALAVAVAVTSCTPVYLAPAAHAPLLARAGDLDVGLYGGTNGTDLTVAYAPMRGLGVIAAASYAKGSSNADSSHTHRYGELGAGYFLDAGHWASVEAYGGAGFGSSSGKNTVATGGTETPLYASGTYLRPFAQVDLALRSSAADFGIVLRGAYVAYRFDTFSPSAPAPSRNQAGLFLEPALFLRAGWQMVKLEAQLGIVLPTDIDTAPNVVGNPFFLHVAVGLHFDLGGLTRREDPEPS